MPARPPNILLLITDQQRYPRHWPDEPGWLAQLMPNDAELARTGLSFRRGFCNTCMCSPSRATLYTGQYPAQHGVVLTLTRGDLKPDPRNNLDVVRMAAGMAVSGEVPRERLGRAFVRGLLQSGQKGGGEPELHPKTQSVAHLLRDAGYHVALKGKWHLTSPVADDWSPADSEKLASEFGFADWDPPDAGENAKAENFGGGVAGSSGEGWDEDYTGQAERWLSQEELPEPFCLVVSLINPHDVLGYPASYERGGYRPEEFRDLEIPLPPTIDEDMSSKPAVHALCRLGQVAYLGALRSQREKQDYVDFYAHLHRVVDEKIGRVLAALGDPGDPASLRTRTVVVRVADHGEGGLSHGGLRQKMFNAYEETIRVPFVVSSPALFPRPVETDAFASLVDVLPTLATLSGADASGYDLRGHDLTPVLARHAEPDGELMRSAGVEMSPVASHIAPADSVSPTVHFTYDDDQAATALRDVSGHPNRVRCVRDDRFKYAVYFDPFGRAEPEYELYDLERDPNEARNLVHRSTGAVLDPADEPTRATMAEVLAAVADDAGSDLP